MRMTVPMEVGICCRDLDALLSFYTEVIGFTHVNTLSVPPEMAAQAGITDGGYRVARIQTSYGERIKLLEPTAPPEPPLEGYFLGRQGNVYLTFMVDDLDQVIERLSTAGVGFLSGKSKVELRPGVYVAFTKDPEGNVLEFVEYSDIQSYRPDLF